MRSTLFNLVQAIKRYLEPRPSFDHRLVPRHTFPILQGQRHVAAREVVPAIAGHLGHRRRRLDQVTGLLSKIYDDLIAGLDAEPCVIERDQMTAELLEAPAKLRNRMGRK